MKGARTGPMDPFPINPTASYSVDLSIFLKDQDDKSADNKPESTD
jgi:hypothetical protein